MQYYVTGDREALLDYMANTTSIADDDELHSDAPTQTWGGREWLICGVFLLVLLIILTASGDRQTNSSSESNETEEDVSSNQPPANTVVVARVDKKQREEERRKTILNLFLSEQNQQKITCEQIRSKSCRTIDTATSSSTGDESQATTIDCHRHDDDSHSSLDEEEGLGVVALSTIRNAPSNNALAGRPRLVSNMCAICLEEYQEGETIVWASNKQCPHAFHRDCLVGYLAKVKAENEYPCPCCRQNFFFENAKDECENEKNEDES